MDVLAFLTLDIQRPNISAIVYGMQGDRQSRAIRAQLVDGSTQWTPPAGTFFVISYAKPDGTHGMYSQTETGNAAVTVSGSVATIALAEQVLTVAGDVPMTLTMFSADGERLSAFTWLLIVKPAAYSDAAFMSTDYYNLLTEQITAVLKAQESITGLTATATTLAPGSAATVTVTGGTGADDPFNFKIGIPRGYTGAQGATGAAAEITAQIVEYQAGTSGTTAPTGAWSTTVPAVPAGQYLWTRTTVRFNTGNPVVSYSVGKMGVDGAGSVKSINKQSPDGSGNVTLIGNDIPTTGFTSITAALASKAPLSFPVLESPTLKFYFGDTDNKYYEIRRAGNPGTYSVSAVRLLDESRNYYELISSTGELQLLRKQEITSATTTYTQSDTINKDMISANSCAITVKTIGSLKIATLFFSLTTSKTMVNWTEYAVVNLPVAPAANVLIPIYGDNYNGKANIHIATNKQLSITCRGGTPSAADSWVYVISFVCQ